MNIAFVSSTKKWGGVKTWYLEYALLLQGSGHTISMYARQPEFLEKAARCLKNVSAVDFGIDFNPAAILRFYREFKRSRVDVVIVNVGKDLSTAGVAARMLGIPVIQRIGLPDDIRPAARPRLLHRYVDPFFLCPCAYIAEGLLKGQPWLNASRVKVILNGKIPSSHRLTVKRPLRLIATQQLNQDKGHLTLLKAAADLRDENFTLDIVGSGKIEAELKQAAFELGLSDKVIWHGFSSNVEAKLEQADIFLLASLSEGLPNTLLEALAAGLIPICRDVGGVKEVWPQSMARWMLPYEADHLDFAQKIRNALQLPDDELLALKTAARHTCETVCNQIEQAKLLEQWLLEIIEKWNGRAQA